LTTSKRSCRVSFVWFGQFQLALREHFGQLLDPVHRGSSVVQEPDEGLVRDRIERLPQVEERGEEFAHVLDLAVT
jgi:hypothetical protein